MKGLRIGLVAVVVTAASWISTPPASAETILYEQMAVPASANGILSYADPNDPTKDSEGADDFTVPSGETWTVTSVEVFGSSYVDDVADDFVVNVYADGGGAPAGLLETRAAVGTLLGPITGIVAEHRLVLATPLLLAEGTYWLGVQAQAKDGFTFWHWLYDEGSRGAEAQWRNPGGGLGMGCSEFTSITTCRVDGNGLTFRLLSAADDETSGIQFSSASFDVSERYAPNGRAAITVTRSGDVSGPASVEYATSDGTALSAKDYVAASGTLLFAPGESSKTFPVRILRDTSTEGTETVTLTLREPSAGTGLGTPNPATLSIHDQT